MNSASITSVVDAGAFSGIAIGNADASVMVCTAAGSVPIANSIRSRPMSPAIASPEGAFVLAAVWTLLVHTLRTEALEAGDASGIGRERLPGLAPLTLLASGLSVVLALALFVALPRLRSNIVRGPGVPGTGSSPGWNRSPVPRASGMVGPTGPSPKDSVGLGSFMVAPWRRRAAGPRAGAEAPRPPRSL